MKRLKYILRIVTEEMDMDGNQTEREILLEKSVPDNEFGRSLAEKEAYNGIIEEYDDGKPDPVPPAEEDMWGELDAAYEEGYTEGYQEGVNTAYDE